MDEKMEDSFDTEGFQLFEIDLDYEFDASRYFDFSRMESLSEAREAELWFETAGSYPPSPYISKLIMWEDVHVEDLNTLAKSEAAEHTNSISTHSGPDVSVLIENCRDCEEVKDRSFFNVPKNGQTSQQAFASSVLDRFLNDCAPSTDVDSHAGNSVTKGWTCYSHMNQDITKVKTKSAIKARVSTLMKPTASQLAKQKQPWDIKGSSRFVQRFHKPLEHKSEKSLENSSVNESQAAKRQKLEGGHLRKVLGIKQQTNLIHKVLKKNGLLDGSNQSRLRLTIPREPELETSQRAQRIRPKHSTEVVGHILSAVASFKARPLNRKILAAPSMPLLQKSTPGLPEFQEFHLKTSQRAMQPSFTASLSLQRSNNSDKVSHNCKTASSIHLGAKDSKNLQHQALIPSQPQKSEVIGELKGERNEELSKFKARPLNKKILSSKGDMGVFISSKRETTVPMEFDFQTDKRLQQNPPIELFKKLSLKSELQQQNTIAESALSRNTCILIKGSKENRYSLQQQNKISDMSTEKLQRHGAKQTQYGSDGRVPEIRSRANMCRSSGIR
ncbi:protein TPX2 [Magnolia sinica]|uniref:protein TPX2 n=1 Tax=Magnolia sinica TaxID=86752 RepID=UPI00265AA24D|nr:protein TPX2 [Magnolia sinica]